jgi:hypothetical protein
MTDKSTPNRAANMEKAEGDRDRGTLPDSESSSGRTYHDDDGDNAGGITNRSMDEEAENQEALPERGQSQRDERADRSEPRRPNEDVER